MVYKPDSMKQTAMSVARLIEENEKLKRTNQSLREEVETLTDAIQHHKQQTTRLLGTLGSTEHDHSLWSNVEHDE